MTGTTYSARFVGPEVIQRGSTTSLTCPVYHDGALVTPTGGSLTIYDSAGAVVVTGSVTVSASIATYSLAGSATSSFAPTDDWRMEWSLTFTGEAAAVVFTRSAVLALRRLYPVVTDADLLRRHPDLAARRPSTESSYQDYLDEAWAQIEAHLISLGRRPWLTLNQEALRTVHLTLTLSLVYRSLATGGEGSADWALADRYAADYAAALSSLALTYADPRTGTDAAPGRRRGLPTVWLSGRS